MEALDPDAGSINVGDSTIALKIGAEERKVHVHEPVLRKTSGFFDAALKKGWREGEDRIIALPEDDGGDIYAYVQWLYTGKIFAKTKDVEGLPDFGPLAKLYVLGGKLLDDKFQDRVLDALVCLSRKQIGQERYLPNMSDVEIIYNATGHYAPARCFLIDLFTLEGDECCLGADGSSIQEEFKDDLLWAVLQSRKATDKYRKTRKQLKEGVPCRYHKHGEDEPCGSTEK